MEEAFSRQLKKGILELLVLRQLSRGRSYGYELLFELNRCSGGLFQLKEGTLYPVLYRLEDGGLVQSVWSVSEARKKPKKYYELTPSGEEALRCRTQVWGAFDTCVNAMLEGAEGK